MKTKLYLVVFGLLTLFISQQSCKEGPKDLSPRLSGDSIFIHRPTLMIVPYSVVSQGTEETQILYRQIEDVSRYYKAKFQSDKLDVIFGRTQLVTYEDLEGNQAPVFTNMKMDGYEMAIFDAQGKPHYAKSWDSEDMLVAIMDSLQMPINPSSDIIRPETKEEASKKVELK
jgi:hypothetical protein